MDKELAGRSKAEIAAELEANRAALIPAAKAAANEWTGRVYAKRAKSRARDLVERVRYTARARAADTRAALQNNVYAAAGGVLVAGALAGFLLHRKFRK